MDQSARGVAVTTDMGPQRTSPQQKMQNATTVRQKATGRNAVSKKNQTEQPTRSARSVHVAEAEAEAEDFKT